MTSPTSWVVLKFGGTSVSSAAHWDTISGVVRARLAEGVRPVVVHSALAGVTNLLEALPARALEHQHRPLLAEIHERYGLPPDPLHELIDGAVWDLEERTVADTDDLLAYAGLVAGSVGAMMLPFLVDDRAEIAPLEPTARALGQAMQITNILRDVGEDLEQLGRLYLPREALDRFGLTRAIAEGAFAELLRDRGVPVVVVEEEEEGGGPADVFPLSSAPECCAFAVPACAE